MKLESAVLLIALVFAPSFLQGAEKWVQAEGPHFTILTTAGEEVARQWAIELEKFRRTLQLALNVPEGRVRPVTIVLFKTERAMKPYKPLENGKPKDVGGFFVTVCDSHAFALALDSDPREIRRILFHEAVHWHSAAGDLPLPTWLEEGVAEIYSTFEVRKDGKVSFGRPIQGHVQLLGGKPFDVSVLFKTSRDTVKFNTGNGAQLFYARSWATAHYLFFGQDTPGRESVRVYLEAMRSGSHESAFTLAFGVEPEEFSRRLAAYTRKGTYTLYSYAMAVDDFEATLAVRPANPAEIQRALGVLLIGSRNGPTPEAHAHLRKAAQLDPTLPRVWQALGETALFERDHGAAAEHFHKAVLAGSDSYYVHYGLAACRLQSEDAIAGLHNPAEISRAAKHLRRAIELNPRYLPAYESLAGLIHVLDNYEPADRPALEHAHKLAPESARIRIGLALCDLRENRTELGKAALQAVVDAPATQPEDRRFAAGVMEEEAWKSAFARIEAAFTNRQFGELIELIAAARAEFTSVRHRQTLDENHRIAVASEKLGRAVKHLNEQEFHAARVLIEEVLASDARTAEKAEARRLMNYLSTRAK